MSKAKLKPASLNLPALIEELLDNVNGSGLDAVYDAVSEAAWNDDDAADHVWYQGVKAVVGLALRARRQVTKGDWIPPDPSPGSREGRFGKVVEAWQRYPLSDGRPLPLATAKDLDRDIAFRRKLAEGNQRAADFLAAVKAAMEAHKAKFAGDVPPDEMTKIHQEFYS